MERQFLRSLLIVGLAALAAILFLGRSRTQESATLGELERRFAALSANGNSTCSAAFRDAVARGTTGVERLQGSCCSAMDFHRYVEQVRGLRRYADIPEIPPDPYDIDAKLAQELMASSDMPLTPAQQREYETAMAKAHEKGPCCCRCWRWYVYGGLGKILITKYHFSGEEVAQVWDLSDGCGGASDHLHTS